MDFPNDTDFMGKNGFVWFIGFVEEAGTDPLGLGRVKVRCKGFHPEETDLVPTKDLPWSIVIQPTTSAGTSGIGWSNTGLLASSQVFGFFMDGETAQFPVVLGTIPYIHRPNAPQNPGNSPGGYTNDPSSSSNVPNDNYNTGTGKQPYHGQGQENPSKYPSTAVLPNQPGIGAVTGDDQSYLTYQTNPWPLTTYTKDDIAASGAGKKFRVHAATARALDAVAKSTGKRRIISSSRDPAHNARVHGAKRSMHIQGKAFDVDAGGGIAFLQACVRQGFTGFGCYGNVNAGPSGVKSYHVDTGGVRAWGPNFRSNTAPAWFTNALKAAGWGTTKYPLKGTPTNPGQPQQPINNNADGGTGDATNANNDATKDGNNDPNTNGDSNLAGGNGGVYNTPAQGSDIGNTIGLRNNNPFNVSLPIRGWNGGGNVVGAPGQSGFGSFSDLNTGYAAGVQRINTYIEGGVNGSGPLDTIAKMNTKYATDGNWGRGVSSISGIGLNDKLDTSNSAQMAALQKGILSQEQGASNANGIIGAVNGTGGPLNKQTNQNKMPGFTDPTNSLPYGKHQGKPSTPMAALGDNAYAQSDTLSQDGGSRMGGFPAGQLSFGEPQTARAPKYGFNQVYASRTGHEMHFDDSPGAETILVRHNNGTKLEMMPGGTLVTKSTGNHYRITAGNTFDGTVGDHYIGVQGDWKTHSTSDILLQSDGSMQVLSYNDYASQVAGKYDICAGDALQIKAKRIFIGAEDIHFYATNSINLEAEKAINIKSTEKISVQADKSLDVKIKEDIQIKTEADFKLGAKNANIKADTKCNVQGSEVNVKGGDTVKIGGGGSVQVNSGSNKATPDWVSGGTAPSDASSSSPKDTPKATNPDIGKAPKRKKVNKQKIQTENSDASITDSSYNAYGTNI